MRIQTSKYQEMKETLPFYFIKTLYSQDNINILEYEIIKVIDLTRKYLITENNEQLAHTSFIKIFKTEEDAQEEINKILTDYFNKHYNIIKSKYEILTEFRNKNPEYFI